MRRIVDEDDEGTLRDRLRSEWPASKFGELVWVEAARGGSVGAPDLFVPLGARGYLPLELKHWRVDLHGVPFYRARPSQLRFHRLAAEAGQRTAFCGLLSDGNVLLVPGWHCNRWRAGEVEPYREDVDVHVLSDVGEGLRIKLIEMLEGRK